MSVPESAAVFEVERLRSARVVAWIAWLVPTSLTLVGLAIISVTLDAPYPGDAWGFRGYGALFSLTTATVGAIVLAHQPHNRIARLMIVVALLSSLQLLAAEYLVHGAVAHPGSLPAVEWVAWVFNWVWIAPFVLVVLFFLLFPDGRWLSRPWRAVAWLAIISGVATALTGAFLPGPLTDFPLIDNPLPIGEPSQFDIPTQVARLGLFASLVLGAWSLLLRYRRADTIERLQLRWVAYAAAIAALAAPFGFLAEEWGQVLFILALCGLPIAGGIAILRFRLYEIDLLINRTLVYGLLTAVLAGIYAASVALMQRLFTALTGEQSDGAIVLTTLIVVIAFTPAKNGLQAIVDRRFKEVDDSTASLAELTTILETRLWPIDREATLRRLLEVSVDAFGATGGSIRLGSRQAAQAGEQPEEPALTASAGRGATRVSIAMGPRRSGRPYSDGDRRVLMPALEAVAAALSDG